MLEDKLPNHLLSDPDIQKYLICRKHSPSEYCLNGDGDVPDIPYFRRHNCPGCEKENREEKGEESSSPPEKIYCEFDCGLKYLTFCDHPSPAPYKH